MQIYKIHSITSANSTLFLNANSAEKLKFAYPMLLILICINLLYCKFGGCNDY